MYFGVNFLTSSGCIFFSYEIEIMIITLRLLVKIKIKIALSVFQYLAQLKNAYTLQSTRVPRSLNWERSDFSTNGAETTGYLQKNKGGLLPHTV